MIVVVGHPRVSGEAPPYRPGGTAALAAIAAARRGAAVQLIGKVGDDDAGDALLVELARAGVGHAALLRDPASATPREPEPVQDESVDADPDALTDAGAAHAAERPTLDPADIDLGLRYFTDFRVVLVAEPLAEPIRRVVLDAARYSGAALILVAEPGVASPDDFPDDVLVLEQPLGSAGDGFAGLLGEVAAAIDAGSSPTDALRSAVAVVGAVRPAPG